MNDGRVQTVNHLLEKIKIQGRANHVKRLDQVSRALIDLAYYKSPDEDDDKKKKFDIPKKQKIMAIHDFDDVLVPTSELAVSMTKDYSKIVGKLYFCFIFTFVLIKKPVYLGTY